MLITYPNELLKQKSVAVTKFDRKLMDLVRDMWSVVDSKSNPGVGLAAIQIGKPLRVIAIDSIRAVSTRAGHVPMRMIMVNPEIIGNRGLEGMSAEGCLSFPGAEYICKRHMWVTVKYQNLQGKPCEIELKGLNAVIAQHEIDHTMGILMIDRATIPHEQSDGLGRPEDREVEGSSPIGDTVSRISSMDMSV
jgi:peptide deformylase